MRTKVEEIPCKDDTGNKTIVVKWLIQAEGMKSKSACCSTAFSLEDGSPVTPVGGKFEHFYSGKLFTPA
jgi:hypothetical protein